jgi:hypothetical protein
MKINNKNIERAAVKYFTSIRYKVYHEVTSDISTLIINAYMAGAKSMSSNTVPTHCRFLKKKDADHWGCTTKEWLQIEVIQGNQVSTYDFAWVPVNQLEFKTDKPTMCAKCHDNKVMRIGEKCKDCEQEEYDDD